MEKTYGNSNKSTASAADIGFLNEKERKEWVNFLKTAALAVLFGGVDDWNFGRTTAQL